MTTSIEELRCSELLKHTIQATDGEIGSLSDILFDDETWSVRYFVVKTGGWLSGRKVLILPQSVNRTESPGDTIPVQLTRQQIKESPDVDTDRPVSRQHEVQLGTYYGFGMVPAVDAVYTEAPVVVELPVGRHEDPHLRSAKELKGYSLRSAGEELGKVEDMTVDWKVLRMTSVITNDDRLLPIDAVRRMSWEEQTVDVRPPTELPL